MSPTRTTSARPARSTPSKARYREASTSTILGVAAISVLIHVVLLYLADRSRLSWRPQHIQVERPAESSRTEARRAPAPPPTCEANVTLAMAARVVVCNTPLMERGECTRATMDDWSLGLIVCNALTMSSEVELVEPEVVEQIEAEMLEEPAVAVLLPEPEPTLPDPSQAQPAAPPPPPPPERPLQVVEITQPKTQEPPKDARFLSDFDSSVEQETVARGSNEDMVERPDPMHQLEAKENPREAAMAEIPDRAERPSKNPDAPEGPGKLAMRKPGESEPAREAQQAETAGIRTGKDAQRGPGGYEDARGTGDLDQKAREASAGKTGEGGGGGGRPLLPNLRPTEDILERAIGGGSVDKLDNVASGDITALNSKGWKYASFFNRVKREVHRNWHPVEAYLRRDPAGNVYGVKDRHTVLRVTIDTKGKLQSVIILKRSGVDVLDEAAVSAIRETAPFPNPPAALADPKTGLITFPFGFSFEVDRDGQWRFLRRH